MRERGRNFLFTSVSLSQDWRWWTLPGKTKEKQFMNGGRNSVTDQLKRAVKWFVYRTDSCEQRVWREEGENKKSIFAERIVVPQTHPHTGSAWIAWTRDEDEVIVETSRCQVIGLRWSGIRSSLSDPSSRRGGLSLSFHLLSINLQVQAHDWGYFFSSCHSFCPIAVFMMLMIMMLMLMLCTGHRILMALMAGGKNAISNAILIPHPVASLILHVLPSSSSSSHSLRYSFIQTFPSPTPIPSVPPFIHSFDLFHLVISSSWCKRSW